MKILIIAYVLLLQHCNNTDFTLAPNYISEQIYKKQATVYPEENTPFHKRRVYKLKNVRNTVFEINKAVPINNYDTLYLVEDFNNNFIAGQVWTSSSEAIKYKVNLNKSDSVSYFDQDIFSKELILLVEKWELEQIRKHEKNGTVVLPVSQCYITRVIIERKRIKEIECFRFNLNF